MSRAGDTGMRILTLAGMAATVAGLMRLFANAPAIEAEYPEAVSRNLSEDMAQHWSGEIDFAPAYAALDPLTDIADGSAPSLFDPADDYWGLPRTSGYEETALYCSACHSLRIVMQQHQSRDGWDYLLTWMSETQGMAQLHPDDRELILDYLSRTFGEEGDNQAN